jgi:hypothetical protein
MLLLLLLLLYTPPSTVAAGARCVLALRSAGEHWKAEEPVLGRHSSSAAAVACGSAAARAAAGTTAAAAGDGTVQVQQCMSPAEGVPAGRKLVPVLASRRRHQGAVERHCTAMLLLLLAP